MAEVAQTIIRRAEAKEQRRNSLDKGKAAEVQSHGSRVHERASRKL